MKNRITKGLYFLSLLSTMFFTPTVEAKMSVKAFKGVTKTFRPGKEYMSPLWGEIGLETGLFHDWRLYGNFQSGMKDGRREYMKDNSSDPLWRVTKELFPSPAGDLAPTVINNINLGRFATPETVAVLLNYTNRLRELGVGEPQQQSPRKKIDSDLSLLKLEYAKLTSPETSPENKGKKKKGKQLEPRFSLEETKAKIAELESAKEILATKQGELELLNEKAMDSLLNSLGKKEIKDYLEQENVTAMLEDELKDDAEYKDLNMKLKQANAARQIQEALELKGKIQQKLDKTLAEKKSQNPKWGIPSDAELSSMKLKWQENIKNETIKIVINEVRKSIEQENDSLAPKHTIEQVITGFFCEQFNDRGDMKAFLEKLDKDIVDENEVAAFDVNDSLSLENVKSISERPDGNLSQEEIHALANASMFVSPVPYKPGDKPVSNSAAQKYDRKNDVLLGETIAECVEMAGRHWSNLLLFNQETRQFDLSHIKKVAKVDNLYFNNFEVFYRNQSPDKANDGSSSIRSAWNKVVADLNAFDDAIKINYMKGNNELDAGFINFIKTFQKIFDLKLDELPILNNFDSNKQYEDANLAWVGKSMLALCKAMNPNHKYTFELSRTSHDNNDVSGIMTINVNPGRSDQFSFELYSFVGKHSDIRNIKANVEGELMTNSNRKLSQAMDQIKTGDTEESLLLLIQNAGTKVDLKNPLYQLFHNRLVDNDTRIGLLREIADYIPKWKDQEFFRKNKKAIFKLLEHIFEQTSWDDPDTVRNLSRALLYFESLNKDIISKDEDLKEVIYKGVKKFDLSDSTDTKVVELEWLPGLESIDLSRTQISEISLQGFKKLQNLNLSYSGVTKIDGLEGLSELTKLNLAETRSLSEVSLKGLDKLQNLNLSYSAVGKIDGLDGLSELTLLDLRGTTSLNEISVKGLKKLDKLYLRDSEVRKIDGLDGLTELTELSWPGSSLREISVKGFNKLKSLELSDSKVTVIDGLEGLPELSQILLPNTQNLSRLYLKDLNKFQNLELFESGVTEIGLDGLPELTLLDLRKTTNLNELSVNNLKKLERIDLRGSAVKKMDGLDGLSALTQLNLGNTKNLSELSLRGLKKLDILDVGGSKIEKVELDGLPELMELKLDNANALSRLSLKDLNKIKKLELQRSAIKEIGLDGLSELTELNLRETNGLNELSLKNLKKLDELNLQDSEVRKIDGLDGLSELTRLDLGNTKSLSELSLKGLNKLNNLELGRSAVKKIELEGLPELSNLFLHYMKSLSELSLKDLNKLTFIHDVLSPSVKTIYLENLNKLTELNLKDYANLEKIVFTGQFDSLKKIAFPKNANLKVEGLDHLMSSRADGNKIELKDYVITRPGRPELHENEF